MYLMNFLKSIRISLIKDSVGDAIAMLGAESIKNLVTMRLSLETTWQQICLVLPSPIFLGKHSTKGLSLMKGKLGFRSSSRFF